MKKPQKEEPRIPVTVWLLGIAIVWVVKNPLRRLLRLLCNTEDQPRPPETGIAASDPFARNTNASRRDSETW